MYLINSFMTQPLSYLLRKSMDWFRYDNGPGQERVKKRRSVDAHYWTATLSNWQKQPLEVLYNRQKLFVKIPQYSQQTPCKFIRKSFQQRYFPVNIAIFLRTPIESSKSTFGSKIFHSSSTRSFSQKLQI